MNKILPKAPILIIGSSGYLGGAIVTNLSKNNILTESISADVTNFDEVKKEAERISRQYENIPGIIYCVSAPLVRKPILLNTQEEFLSQFSVNVTGAFNVFKLFFPLLASGGSIVGVLSKSLSNVVNTPMGSYLSSKYALRGILRTILADHPEKKLKIYGVAPAFMTGGLNGDLPKGVVDFISTHSAPNEITTADEVAEKIYDLINGAMPEASGKIINIPGGITVDL